LNKNNEKEWAYILWYFFDFRKIKYSLLFVFFLKDSFSVAVPTVVNERHIFVDGKLISLFRLVPTRVRMVVCLIFVGG